MLCRQLSPRIAMVAHTLRKAAPDLLHIGIVATGLLLILAAMPCLLLVHQASGGFTYTSKHSCGMASCSSLLCLGFPPLFAQLYEGAERSLHVSASASALMMCRGC